MSIRTPATAVSFDGATAGQQAEQARGAKRAEKDKQAADRNRPDRAGGGGAIQRTAGKARADTATVTGFASAQGSDSDPGLLWRLYRDRVGKILSQAGSVVTIDHRDDERLLLQGAVK